MSRNYVGVSYSIHKEMKKSLEDRLHGLSLSQFSLGLMKYLSEKDEKVFEILKKKVIDSRELSITGTQVDIEE